MSRGRYGKHGGQYVPETLMNEIIRLEKAYEHYKNDPEFVQELDEPEEVKVARKKFLLLFADNQSVSLFDENFLEK